MESYRKSLFLVSTTLFLLVSVSASPGITLFGDANINLNGNNITNCGYLNGQDCDNLGNQNLSQVLDNGNKAFNTLNMTFQRITNIADPVNAQDAATLSWVNNNDNYEADTTVNGCQTCLDIGTEVTDTGGLSDGDDVQDGDTSSSNELQTLSDVLGRGNNMNSYDIVGTNAYINFDYSPGARIYANGGTGSRLELAADGGIDVVPDADATTTSCTFSSGGDLDCDGTISASTKNFVQAINETYNAVYTSQESPMVRAVYEGQTTVTGGAENVTLPHHFSAVVSDSKPMLRVQVTPHSLTTVAVTSRSDSWIVIETGDTGVVKVDFRITGVREGYEHKQVVRKKSKTPY